MTTQHIAEENRLHFIVFTKPNCTQCNMVKTRLDKAGITYDTRQLGEQTTAVLEEFAAAGHKSAPVVSVYDGTELWDEFSGFNPDRLNAAIAAHRDKEAA